MSKYRILKVEKGWSSIPFGVDFAETDGYVVQRKGWIFWKTLVRNVYDGPCGAVMFSSEEDAKRRIENDLAKEWKQKPKADIIYKTR